MCGNRSVKKPVTPICSVVQLPRLFGSYPTYPKKRQDNQNVLERRAMPLCDALVRNAKPRERRSLKT
jgi:hypothetical protein